MLKSISLAILSLLAAAWIETAAADTGFVAGDSLGVGVSMASRLKSVAKNSVSIRANGVPIGQIEQAPAGSVVFLSLGTNDAVSNIEGLQGGIDRIVQAAKSAQVRLVWIGPPCVFKPWDTNASALDGILQKSLKASGVTYVSMRDPKLCDRSVRGPDGVHFNMRGYHYMWDMAREAAGFTGPAGETTVADASPRPRSRLHKSRRKKKRTHHKTASAASHAPADAAAPAAAPAQPESNPQ